PAEDDRPPAETAGRGAARSPLAHPAVDRPLHPVEELLGREAGARLGGAKHGRRLPGPQGVLIRQRRPLRTLIVQQVFDVAVQLLGVVVHQFLFRSRPARFNARNCRTLTFTSLSPSSCAVSLTE